MNLCCNLPPLSLPETIKYLFNGIDIFIISFLAKDSILDVWQGSEYANEYCYKILGG